MLENVRIRNFRVFRDLRIDALDRVNLFAGLNNSGKTTLLEALFLLSGGGNPKMALNANIIRGADAESREAIREVLWRPMFSELDFEKRIAISGRHTTLGQLDLTISLSRSDTMEVSLGEPGSAPITDPADDRALSFAFTASGRAVEGRIRAGEKSVQIERPDAEVPFPAAFLSSRAGNTREDAVHLGRLGRRKKRGLVLDALRAVEPKLESVEDNSASGSPMIWGDIGLSELIPLPAMGEGMTRVARLVLAISAVPGGLVLVDEIENGLHHSILPDVWRAVGRVARKFDTQIVATTHSFECVEAAYQSLRDGGFLLHRIDADEKHNRGVTYQLEEVDVALRHGMEVR